MDMSVDLKNHWDYFYLFFFLSDLSLDDFHKTVLKFTDSFFCCVQSALNPLKWIFLYSFFFQF